MQTQLAQRTNPRQSQTLQGCRHSKASHLPRRVERLGDPSLSLLIDLAVKLEMVSREIETSQSYCPAAMEHALEQLATQFDKAFARAVKLGVPLNTQLKTIDREGRAYLVCLTDEGVEYRVA
jgi:hypothetical protein